MIKEEHKIKCPKCGMEYIPSEIFFPEDFIGEDIEVVKNESGKIEYSSKDMELEEEYTCDCGCTFKVKATITFTVDVIEESDFSEDYVTQVLPKNRATLKED